MTEPRTTETCAASPTIFSPRSHTRASEAASTAALVRALGEHGLLDRVLPLEGRPSALELCRIREALATESTEAETAFALQGLGTHPILTNGRPELVKQWVPAVVSGDAVAAFALTEPEAGSDVASLSLVAERDGDGWRLTGVKKWISNAPEADLYTVFARTTPDAGARGLTAFVVPGDAPHLSGKPLELVSPHAIGTLEFDGVRVGGEAVLGELDDGFRVAMRTLNLFRPSVGAALSEWGRRPSSGRRVRGARQAFGGPLKDSGRVACSWPTLPTGSRPQGCSSVQGSERLRRGSRRGVPKLSAMAKLFATETAQQVVDRRSRSTAPRHSSQGICSSRLYRDVRALRIYEGSSEIQREIIARELYKT